jgi:hypothetical protein
MTKLAGILAFVLTVAGAAAAAQTPAPGQAAPQLPDLPAGRPIGAGEIQKLFDAFTLIQAQEALQLSEAQYGKFVTRLKALQDARRKHQQVRNQMLGDLRRLTNPQSGSRDETVIAERLKAFRDEDERAAGELRKAYDGVDETLDVGQQARFRLFEERMEQQKLELLMRARQTARSQAQRRGRL